MRNIEVMWLLSKLTPDDKTICNFRKDNAKAIKKVFREFNKFALTQGLFGCETVAVDGSKFRANNSRNNIYTRDNVNKELEKIQSKLNAKVAKYLEEHEQNDQKEEQDSLINESKTSDAIKALNAARHEFTDILSEMDKAGEDQLSKNDPDSRLMRPGGDGREFDARYNVQCAVDAKNCLIADYEVTNDCNDLWGSLKTWRINLKPSWKLIQSTY